MTPFNPPVDQTTVAGTAAFVAKVLALALENARSVVPEISAVREGDAPGRFVVEVSDAAVLPDGPLRFTVIVAPAEEDR